VRLYHISIDFVPRNPAGFYYAGIGRSSDSFRK